MGHRVVYNPDKPQKKTSLKFGSGADRTSLGEESFDPKGTESLETGDFLAEEGSSYVKSKESVI